jgi:demethylphylloquinol methyltransferase
LHIDASVMSYDQVAPYYDLLAHLYSGGGIKRAKLAHLTLIRPGTRVLYAGAGTGAECVEAAAIGAQVTVVELSKNMLDLCRARLLNAGQTATLIHDDVLGSGDPLLTEPFDLVVAPFFLNVFSPAVLPFVIKNLATRVRSGGLFVSVDFRAPVAQRAFGLLQRLYYWAPLALFYLLTHNPWHPLYDYERVIRGAALPLKRGSSLIHTAWGLPFLETAVWKKK